MGFSSSLNALYNSPVKPSVQGLLCVGSFLITVSIPSSVIVPFRLSGSSSVTLEGYIFLEICPFHLGFHISWHIVLCSNSLQSFYFGSVSCSLSSFISDCVYLGPLFS